MIKDKFPFIEDFLNRYSYSTKMKFLLFVGVFYGFFLIGMILFIQFPRISLLKLQVDGLNHHELLNSLLNTCCDLEVMLMESKGENPNIQEVFVEPVALFKNDILKLIDYNLKDHRLELFSKLQTYSLSRVALLNLPVSQSLLAAIVATRLQEKSRSESLGYEVSFEMMEYKLKNNLGDMTEQFNPVIFEKNKGGILELFKQYQNAVILSLESFKNKDFSSTDMIDYFRGALKDGQQLGESLVKSISGALRNQLDTLYVSQYLSICIIIFGLLSFLIMYTTRVIRRPLEALKDAAIKLASGDLSIRVPISTNDEVAVISRAFNGMASLFEKSLVEANKISLNLVVSATAIFDIAKQMEESVSIQEKIIHKMSHQVSEIAVKTKNFAYLLNEVNNSFIVTSRLAQLGNGNLIEMERILEQMSVSSRSVVTTLASLKGQIDKIDEVVNSVVEMADQCNLLSLNTTIKVSQTMAESEGFPVIADRIREMSDQVTQMAFNIEEALQDIAQVFSIAILEMDNFFSLIINQFDDERIVNESLSKLTNQILSEIDSFEKINVDIETQFLDYMHIHELNARFAKITYQAGNSVRRLYSESEFLFQGTQNLRKEIEKLKFSDHI